MPRKEVSGKAKEWERERRERLNESFNLLNSLLPGYDPSITKSKIEILQKTILYITDLQKENKGLTTDKKDQAWKQIGHLKLRVDNLLCRIQQLSSLLKDAGISIPREPPKDGPKVFNGRQQKWSNKFQPEDIVVLLKKNKKPAGKKKSPSKSKAVSPDSLEKKEHNGVSVVDHSATRKSVSSPTSKKRQRSVSSGNTKKVYKGRKKKSKRKEIQTSNHENDKADKKNSLIKYSVPKEASTDMAILDSNVTVLTPAMPQVPRKLTVITSTVSTTSINQFQQSSCFVLASAPQPMPSYNPPQTSFIVKSGPQSLKKATLALQPLLEVVPKAAPVLEASVPLLTQKKGATVVVTNSHLLTAPIMATGIQTCPAPSVLSAQGVVCPGTLILANGSVVPILPAPSTSELIGTKCNSNLMNQASCIPALPENPILLMQNSVQSSSLHCDKSVKNTSELIATKCNSNIMNQASCIPALPENPILLMQNSVQSSSLHCDKSVKPRVYPLCLPKPWKTRNDFTKTTFVNKVPISAVAQKNNIRVQSSSRCIPFPQVSVNKPTSKTENTKNIRRTVQVATGCSNKEIGSGIMSKTRSNNKKLMNPILKDCNPPNSNKILKNRSERKVVVPVSSDHTCSENIVELAVNTNQDSICPPLKGGHLTNTIESKCTKADKSDNALHGSLTSQKGKRVSVEIEETVSNKRTKFNECESPDKSDSLCLTSTPSGSTSDGISLSFTVSDSAVPINSIHYSNPIVIHDSNMLTTSVTSASISSVISLSTAVTAVSSPTPPTISTLHTCTCLTTPATSDILVYSSCAADSASVAPTPSYADNSASLTNLSASSTTAQLTLPVSENSHDNFVPPKTSIKSAHRNLNDPSVCSLRTLMSSNDAASVEMNTNENVITAGTVASNVGTESNVIKTIGQAINVISSSATQTSAPVTTCGTIACNVVVATPTASIASAITKTAEDEVVTTVPGEVPSSATTFMSRPNCSSVTDTTPFTESFLSASSVSCITTSASATIPSYANPTNPTGSLTSTSFTNTVSSVVFVDGSLPTSCSSCLQAGKGVGITSVLNDNKNKPVSNPNVFSFTSGEEKIADSNNRNIAKGSENYSIDCLCKSVVKNQIPNNVSEENVSNSDISKDNCEQCKPLVSNDVKVTKVANISNNLPSRPSTFSIKCVMESIDNKAGKEKPLAHTDPSSSRNILSDDFCVRNKAFPSIGTSEKKQKEENDCHSSKSVKDVPNSWNGNNKAVSKNRERKFEPHVTKQSEQTKKMLLSNDVLDFDEKQTSLHSEASESPDVHLQVTTSENIASNTISLSERLGAESVPDAQNMHISQQILSSGASFFSTDASVADKEPRLFLGNPSRNSSLGPDFVKSNNSVVYSNCDVRVKKSEGSEGTEVSEVSKNDFSRDITSKLSSHTNNNTFTPISVSSTICSSVNIGNKENANIVFNTNTPACLSLQNNEFSNDLFSSLQVPHSEHHSESTSPTAAFLLTFPVVTSSKVSEIIGDSQDVGNDSVHGTSNMFHVVSNSDTRLDVMNTKTTFQSPCKKNKKLTEHNFTNDITYSTFNAPQEISKQFIPLESSYKMYESNTFSKDRSREMNSKNWSTLSLNSENKILNEESNRRHIHSQPHTISDCVVNHQQNLGKPQKFSDIFLDSHTSKGSTEIFSNNTCVEGVSLNVTAPLTSNLQPFPGSNFAMPSFNAKISENENGKVPTRVQVGLSDSIKEQSSESLSVYKESAQTHISTSGSVVSRLSNREQDSLTNNSVPYSQYLNQESTNAAYPKYPLNSSHVALEVSRESACPQLNKSAKNHTNSYLPITSSFGYMANQTPDAIRCPPATSFSVANSSSNFSILSWTTLSPMTTVSNKQQCNEFFIQSTQTSPSHQNVTDTSKKFSNQVCLPENSLPKTLEFPDMYNLQQKHSGQDTIVSSIANKTQEAFPHSLLPTHSKISCVNQLSHQYSNNCKSSSTNEKNIRCHTSVASNSYPRAKTSLSEHQNHFPVNWAPVPNICPQQFPSNSTSNETYNRPISSAIVTHVDTVVRKDMGMCNINGSSNLFPSCVSSTCPSFDTKTFTSNSSSAISSNTHGSYQASTQSKEEIISFHNENNKMNSTSRPTNFKKISEIHVSQSQPSESYPISWIQSKLPASSLHSSDVGNNNSFVPSLPTLVGDLALGTNYPVPSNENIHKNKTLPHLSTCVNEFAKPNTVEGNIPSDKLQDKLQHSLESNRDSLNKDVSSMKNTVYDNCSSSQLSAGTFLSVSQLVDQANSSSGPQRDHSVPHHGNLFIHRMELPSKQASFEMQSSEIYPLPSAEMKHNNNNNVYNVSSGQHALAPKGINQHVNVKLNNDHSVQTRAEPILSRKIETNQGISNNSQYRPNASNPMISAPPTSNGSLSFCTSFNTQTTLSVSSSHIPWSTPMELAKQPISKGSSTNCKTSVSNYSAEALIGLNSLNSNERASNIAHEPVGSKIVMLPSPAVSERFATTQFPPPQPPPPPPPLPTSVSRSLQMPPPPFTGDAILSNNYFPPVALSSHSQDMCLNESDQTMTSWRNLTPHIYRDQQEYKNLNSVDNAQMIPSSTGQGNSELLKHSKFIPSVGPSHSHHSLTTRSLPCNFLPDLGPTNSYKSSLLSDTVNPFIFPPPVSSSMAKGSVMQGEKLPVNSHGIASSSSSTFYSESPIRGLRPTVTSAVNNKSQSHGNSSVQCNNKTNTSHRGASCNSSHHLSNVGTIPCTPPKQRARKRVADPIAPSGSANVGSLMDLAYLGVPPMMGSPMITDDSVYVNHPPTFLNSGSSHTTTSLYPAVPPSTQGTFYSTPHCTGPPGSYISVSHPNHLINNSSCSDVINSRVPINNPTVSPTAVNSSSSSLTNFNLSTIFPEINDKVI